MRFLGNVLATVIGIFVFLMLLFFGIVLISAIAGNSSEVVEVKENSVIELDLSEVTNDYAGKFTFEKMPFLNDTDSHDS